LASRQPEAVKRSEKPSASCERITKESGPIASWSPTAVQVLARDARWHPFPTRPSSRPRDRRERTQHSRARLPSARSHRPFRSAGGPKARRALRNQFPERPAVLRRSPNGLHREARNTRARAFSSGGPESRVTAARSS